MSRIAPRAWLNLLPIVLFAILVVESACDREVGAVEARAAAALRLEEYRAEERLPRGVFGAAKMHPEAGYPWVFDYSSATVPRHLVRIYVDAHGRTTLHRMVE